MTEAVASAAAEDTALARVASAARASIELGTLADAVLDRFVRAARESGCSWAEIGADNGVMFAGLAPARRRLLLKWGADLHDHAFDSGGPTPLDCALWGVQNNRAQDGDYPGTVQALLAVVAPTRFTPPIGDEAIDALLARYAALP